MPPKHSGVEVNSIKLKHSKKSTSKLHFVVHCLACGQNYYIYQYGLLPLFVQYITHTYCNIY